MTFMYSGLTRSAAAIALAVICSANASAVTIAAAKALGNGQTLTLDDVVVATTIDTINSGSSKSFTVQDATGGITIFGSNANIDAVLATVALGDKIDIAGTTGSFNGLFQLTAPFTPTLDTAAVGVPAPLATSVADMQNLSAAAEARESVLIKMSNVTFVSPPATFAGSTNYTVTDGTLTASVRVPTNFSSLIGDPIPTGLVNLTGIGTQFDNTNPVPGVPGNGYQLILLDDSSVEIVPEPGTMVLAALGVAAAFGRRCRSGR